MSSFMKKKNEINPYGNNYEGIDFNMKMACFQKPSCFIIIIKIIRHCFYEVEILGDRIGL